MPISTPSSSPSAEHTSQASIKGTLELHVSRAEAETLVLEGGRVGVFVLRPSASEPGSLVLTALSPGTVGWMVVVVVMVALVVVV